MRSLLMSRPWRFAPRIGARYMATKYRCQQLGHTKSLHIRPHPTPTTFGAKYQYWNAAVPSAKPTDDTLARVRSRMAAQNKISLVWIDCETTGLDPENEEIIEIYCFITDHELELVDPEGWGVVIYRTKQRMDQMDDWCVQTHGQNGLTAAVIASKVTGEQAAEGLLAYIKKYVPEKGTSILAGNSVHFDRSFLAKEPYRKVIDYLHYRILDVSSLKEAARMWSPSVGERLRAKKALHRAKDDILESIEEARFYKTAIFERRVKYGFTDFAAFSDPV